MSFKKGDKVINKLFLEVNDDMGWTTISFKHIRREVIQDVIYSQYEGTSINVNGRWYSKDDFYNNFINVSDLYE